MTVSFELVKNDNMDPNFTTAQAYPGGQEVIPDESSTANEHIHKFQPQLTKQQVPQSNLGQNNFLLAIFTWSLDYPRLPLYDLGIFGKRADLRDPRRWP